MKNGEQAAYPTMLYNSKTGEATSHMSGLTKREYFAAMAMQGLISASNKINHDILDGGSICRISVEYADMLLKHLES